MCDLTLIGVIWIIYSKVYTGALWRFPWLSVHHAICGTCAPDAFLRVPGTTVARSLQAALSCSLLEHTYDAHSFEGRAHLMGSVIAVAA